MKRDRRWTNDTVTASAVVPRSAPLTYTSEADTGTWITVGVLAGAAVLAATV